ncbi:tripartite tricarboxylate transporter TctB family protein [Metabacillus arenae]|uniref:Tripartite tricarboxylate transporter TctB family protein n=1 Tax=Metabacillus arenae TaxID=2771434 RepID=A0A926NG81_9BACI|nr:tripartite tricarboxylate transporter TctB family protein [Metabacillus arenae]MBD1382874.1 tripartite tricarboxylate transporter TctB family protein [Metabacillus arenae]
MTKQNYILSGSVLAFSIVFLLLSQGMDQSQSTYSIGPSFWPNVILISMIILSVCLALRTKFSKKEIIFEDDEELMEKVSGEEKEVSSLASVFGVSIVSSLFLYLVAIPILGFILSTFLYIAVISFLLGISSWGKSILLSVIATVLITALFISALAINFPRGVGVFRYLSSLIY